jgi:nitrogen fixation NifU-like protein
MDITSEYTEIVMDHYEHPRNVGIVENANGEGVVGNPACGDVMKLTIRVEDNKIVDAKFKTFGCGAAIATSSMVTEMVKGKSIEEALKISNRTVAKALGGLPKVKMHCSVLAEDALNAAIDDWRKKSKVT